MRTKAIFCPSGEKAGESSSILSGAVVSLRLSEPLADVRNTPIGSPEGLSAYASRYPSGDQDTLQDPFSDESHRTTRLEPPSGLTHMIVLSGRAGLTSTECW